MWVIIDDRGLRHDAWSPDLRRKVRAHRDFGVEQLAQSVVTNFGYIEIKRGRRGTYIRLRPRFVSRNTITGLCILLCELGDQRSRIDWLADTWRHELVYGAAPTIRLVDALCEASVATDGGGIKRRYLGNAGRAFRVDLEEVREFVARAPESRWARQALSLRFGGRWTLSEMDTSNGQVFVRGMGEGYPLYDCAWTCQPLGRSFDEFPDPAYGRFVTDSHREAFQSAGPIHDEVDALINWPRFGTLRTRYERIIAPFFSGSRALLLSAAKVDASINL